MNTDFIIQKLEQQVSVFDMITAELQEAFATRSQMVLSEFDLQKAAEHTAHAEVIGRVSLFLALAYDPDSEAHIEDEIEEMKKELLRSLTRPTITRSTNVNANLISQIKLQYQGEIYRILDGQAY